MTAPQYICWPHAPLHELSAGGAYIVTAGTYKKENHFRTRQRLGVLHRGLLSVAHSFGWRFEAWAVFSNHYHFVGHSPDESAHNLAQMLGLLHEKTAKWINKLDNAAGREVWHNFWETRLTHRILILQDSIMSTKIQSSMDWLRWLISYPWCSAGWFERTARPAQVKTIYGFKIDKLKVLDDYEVLAES